MAATAKYQRARLWEASPTGRHSTEVKPGDIVDRPTRGDLTCLHCPVLLTWVTASVNQKGTEIPAHLRLFRGSAHADDCPLNFRTLIDGLRAKKDVEIDARDNKYFLRLPGEAIEHAVQRTKDTTRKRTNARSWASTFASAARIVKFMHQFDDDEEFANQLRVEYRNPKGDLDVMFWRDFCFDVTNETALRRYYNRLSSAAYRAPVSPVAIVMTAQHEPVETYNGAKHRLTAYTNLEVPYRKRDDNHELVVTVYSEERLSNVHADEQILVLAHGRDWLRSMDNRVEIRLDVNLSWQIAKL
ncbi:hypothetical protein ACVLV4_002789 [Rathayibacter agropyri]